MGCQKSLLVLSCRPSQSWRRKCSTVRSFRVLRRQQRSTSCSRRRTWSRSECPRWFQLCFERRDDLQEACWGFGANQLTWFFQVSFVLSDLPDLLPGQRCAGLHHLSAEPPTTHEIEPVQEHRRVFLCLRRPNVAIIICKESLFVLSAEFTS